VPDGTSTTRPISAPKCPPHHVPARSNARPKRVALPTPQSNPTPTFLYQALPPPKPAPTMPAAPKRTGFKKASSFAPKRAASTTSSAPAAKRAKADSDNEDDGSSESPVVPEVRTDEEGNVYVPVSDQARV
jgi:hypothetical protein